MTVPWLGVGVSGTRSKSGDSLGSEKSKLKIRSLGSGPAAHPPGESAWPLWALIVPLVKWRWW